MPRYIPISDELSLVQQDIKTKKVVTKKTPVNHIWIYDRSGSMSWELPELTSQLADLSKKLPKGDTLTLGWFSGEGQFNWVFKGFKIADSSDYKTLQQAIKKNSTPVGLTCFSEILKDSETVVSDLSVISKTFSLHFFTDGYPVVSNYHKEVSNIFSAIAKIKGKVNAAMFVGYGEYYNKELMTQMAEKLGAMLIHSSMIPEYANSITKLVKLTENSEPKEEVAPLVSDPLAVFTITDQGVMVYSPDEDGKLYVSPQKGKSTSVFYLSTEKPNKKSWDKVEVSEVEFGDNDLLSRALYASALVMTQQTKTDIALEVAGKIGDKAVVDALTNAFTIQEYGDVEEKMNQAIQDVSMRFTCGRDTNYLPPVDAYCVFNLLTELMEDEEAAFFPYHPKFQYEKIGVSSKNKEGYSKFEADKMAKAPFDDVTWHESRLNLSVRTTIPGTIELQDVEGKTASDMSLPVVFSTRIYRNYTFIKDGRVHTKKFFITSSESTYKDLKNKGLVFEDNFKVDGTYGVDVSSLPAINRAIATGKTSATDLCQLAMKEQRLKAQLKSLKYLKGQEVPEDIKGTEQYSEEQVKFLVANGVRADRDGSYNPPRDLEEAKDQYMAKAFEIKIKGMSSLPTVKKVQQKIDAKKDRTPVESLVEEGITKFASNKSSLKTKEEMAKWFDDVMKELKKQLKEVRAQLQQTKFAVIMGKKWFDEFSSREDCELEVEGVNYRFNLKEEAVDI